MSDYYGLWMEKVAERQNEISGVVRGIHEGMDAIIRDSPLDKMLYHVKPWKIDGISLGAVDGGEGMQELSGVAVYMVRASGLINGWGEGVEVKGVNGVEVKGVNGVEVKGVNGVEVKGLNGVEVKGLRGKKKDEKRNGKSRFLRDLDLGAIPIDRQTKARVQFMRAKMEYDMGSRLIKEFAPDFLLMDGSLLVGLEIDPIKTSEYRDYIRSVRKMLRLAQDSHVRVVGVSEDSTSRGLINYLAEKGLSRAASRAMSTVTDASLIQLYIQRMDDFKPMATNPFLPVSNKGREWIRKNTGVDKTFPTFYLQATQFGHAMRVDFPSDGKNIGKEARGIAALLTHLSQIPKRYGYPFPLFLVHSDAELPRKLMDRTALLIQKQIFKEWSDEYLSMYSKKRRESRPGDLE